MSTLAIFGAAAFYTIDQANADKAFEQVLAAGINHIDVAPSYGDAEERLGPWMPQVRDRFFLGCKTTERTKEGAAAELRRSLSRLQVDRFDLYQLHAVNTMDELDKATGPGGALEAVLDARREGLTRYIGITGHGHEAPAVFLEALRRFDFDSVLFPINFVLYAMPDYRRDAEELLRQCRSRDVGVMVIKSIARRPWADRPQTHTTWYDPITGPEMLQKGVSFALSQEGVTGICTAGDVSLLPALIQAAENFTPMPPADQQRLIASANEYATIFG